VKHDLDFLRMAESVGQVWSVCLHLAEYVRHSPEQVTAACCLYLAISKFLAGLRGRRK
jgi:hypothetical protein